MTNVSELFTAIMAEATKPKKNVMPDGMIIYTKNGQVHREDGPAIITDWSQEWFQNGVVHRADGPAMMYKQHPQPRGEMAIKAGGKNIAQWHFNGEYQEMAILDDATFSKYWITQE